MSFQNLTVLSHGRTINDEYIFPESEWNARIEKVRSLIAREKLDGLLIFVEGALTRSNVCYLTNYNQFLTWGCALLIFPREGKPKLIMTIAPRDLTHTQRTLPDIAEYIPVGLNLTSNEHVSTSAIDYMRENDLLAGKKWGAVNLKKMPTASVEPWNEVYPEGLMDFTEALGKIRAVKSNNEITALSIGSTIAKTAVLEYLRCAKAGANEQKLAADIDRLARLKGCETVNLLTYSGKGNETMLRVPWNREFEEGDTVSAFMSVSYLRYYGAYGSTTLIGSKSEEQQNLYDIAERLFEKKLSEMQNAEFAVGYEENCCSEYGVDYYTVVNGVGMDLSDYPDTQGQKLKAQPNMTFTVSLSVKKQSVGSVFIAKNVLVTNYGIFALSGFGA